MAHDLFVQNGKASMFYTGDDVPWHKLGTRLDQPATSSEALEAAGLDYTVKKVPIKAVLSPKRLVPVDDHFATIRTDNGSVLGFVGSRYHPIQNKSSFTFFDSLVGSEEAIFHTAGVLGKGEKIWLLAKLPDYIKIGEDRIDKYVLLYNSHDGSSNVRLKLTPIRVVCSNTLSAALSGSDQEVRIRHTRSASDRLAEAHKLLGLTNDLYKQLDTIFNKMALKKITNRQLLDYCKRLIPDNPEADRNTRTENIRNHILELHASGRGAEIHRGTAFGAYNAVTEMVDHQENRDPNTHLKSIWFGGSGERLKHRAFSLAEAML